MTEKVKHPNWDNDIKSTSSGGTLYVGTKGHVEFPSERKEIYIQFFYIEREQPFICGADGHITTGMLDEIERDCLEFGVFKDPGDYLFKVNFEPDVIGEYGRVELAGYWDMTLISFDPLKEN